MIQVVSTLGIDGSIGIAACRRSQLSCLVVLSIIIAAWATGTVAAQDKASAPPAMPSLSPNSVRSLLKSLEDSKLDDKTKAKAEQLYTQALDKHLAAAKQHEAKAAEYQHQIDTADEELTNAKSALADLPPIADVKIEDDTTLEQLEEQLKTATSDLRKAKEAVEKLDAEPNRRKSRELAIGPLQTSANEAVKKLEQDFAKAAPEGEAPELTTARKTRLRAELLARENELNHYQKELDAYDATRELLRAQRDLAAEQSARADAKFNKLVSLVGERKKGQAADEAHRIRMQVARTDESLKSLAEKNLTLAEERERLVGQVEQLAGQVLETSTDLESLQKTVKETRAKVEQIGLTEAMGLLLRKHRDRMPDSDSYRRKTSERRGEIRSAQSRLMDLDRARSDLAVMDLKVDSIIDDLPSKPADMSLAELKLTVRELLEERRSLLTELTSNQDAYFDMLVAMNNVEREYADDLDEYREYIDQRVLWIRSTDPIHWDDFKQARNAVLWIVSPKNWSEFGRVIGADFKSSPAAYILLVVLLAAAIGLRPRLIRRLNKNGDLAASEECRKYRPTVEAFFITLAIAFTWAMLPYFLSWRIDSTGSTNEFVVGVWVGLERIAQVLFAVGVLVCVCRPNGLGASHFRWSERARTVLRTRFACLVLALLPTTLVFSLCQTQSDPLYRNSLGRICVIVVLFAISVGTHLVLKQLQKPKRDSPGPRRIRFAYSTPMMWYLVGCIIPMLLAGLAVAGYVFTTNVLGTHLRATILMMMAITILGAMLQRWFLISRRRIAFRQALAEQEAAKEAVQDDPSPAAAKVPSVDISMLDRQSRQLLKVAVVSVVFLSLWYIWYDVLPALAALENFTLWTVGSGADAKEITLRHFGFALVIIGVTVVAVRDLPSMLELLLLNRLPFDFGARYALMTVVRYGVLILGFVAAFSALGIRWSQYQWLVAAATVGLGFGLQEIFANFVSGLILLAERPIRVGDVVTVGDVTGTVSKISMRSTIVVNWDRQEFIVPNKDFVTGKVLNWTLSNSINRIVIHVPVSPDSDPAHVRESLLKVAREHPLLTDDPGPIVTFDQFADGTLRFTLRCYLPNMDNRLGTIHDLHESIHRTLLEEGIDVAAPRHNIYISTAEESDVLGTRESAS